MKNLRWPGAWVVVTMFAALCLLGALFRPALAQPAGAQPAGAQPAGARPAVWTLDPAPAWAELLPLADVIVRGRVLPGISYWDAGHTAILTSHPVAVYYALRRAGAGTVPGSEPQQVTVVTEGGVLPGSGLGMLAFDVPSLTTGEEVLLFLHHNHTPGAPPNSYVIAGNEAGKQRVAGGAAINPVTGQRVALSAVYAQLGAAAPGVAAPADWAQREAAAQAQAVQPAAGTSGNDYNYNNIKWPKPSASFSVNVNSQRAGGANGAQADFLNAIFAAADAWNMVGASDFTFGYAGPTQTTETGLNGANEIVFEDKGKTDANGSAQPLAVARVFYSGANIYECDIWINDAYNWDATGAPSNSEVDLQSVVLHELGHWLSLGHDMDKNAVMYPSITLGTLKRTLYDDEVRGIAAIYPCATGDDCNPAPMIAPTPAATLTPEPTPTPAPTPRPTALPAQTDLYPGQPGSLVYTSTLGLHVQVDAPPDAVALTTTLHLRNYAVEYNPDGMSSLDGFRLSADQNEDEQPGFAFAHPITLTVSYSDTLLGYIDKQTLGVYAFSPITARWSNGACGDIANNVADDVLTVPVCNAATFGIFGAKPHELYLPLVQRPEEPAR